MRLLPVELSSQEISEYYEGFSNATLWPLYHDLTAEPQFERRWWESYRDVNRRFADVVAGEPRPRPWYGCRTTSFSWSRPSSAIGDRICGSGSSITFLFPDSRSTRGCRGDGRSWRVCSGPISSAFKEAMTRPTSSGPVPADRGDHPRLGGRAAGTGRSKRQPTTTPSRVFSHIHRLSQLGSPGSPGGRPGPGSPAASRAG